MSDVDAGCASAPGTGFRIETDALGDVAVPAWAYWGAHTARALENFRVSGVPVAVHPHLVRALAQVKHAAALANLDRATVLRIMAAAAG